MTTGSRDFNKADRRYPAMNQNDLKIDCQQATSVAPTAKWLDDETCVEINQFTESSFDTGMVSYEKHALFFSFTGVTEVHLPDRVHQLLSGQGAFHAANVPHRAITKKPTSFVGIFFPVSFLAAQQPLKWESQVILDDPVLHSLMEMVDHELSNADLHAETALTNLCQLLAIHLLRKHSTIQSHKTLTASRAVTCEIMRAIEFIELNLTSPLLVSEINKLTSLSQGAFLRAFKEVTGQAPQQYIIRRRIEIAKHLLGRPNLTIDEIAKKSGFVDQSHFTKAFRKLHGLTPTAFRKR